MAPQSYFLGGKIRASDFNGFANDINEIVGLGAGDSGYGQSQLLVTLVTAGSKVRASNWNELLNSVTFGAQHQGTTISIPADTSDPLFPAPGRIISIIPVLEADIASVRANKLDYDISLMAIETNKISSSKTFVDPTSTGNHWDNTNNPQTYEFKTTFVDTDAMRNFFNAGGEVRISTELTGYDVSHVQSDSWADLLTDIATVKLSNNLTESSAGVGTPGTGFTSMTSTYALVYTKGGTGDYVQNQLNVYAKTNGSAIDIKVEYNDGHQSDTGSWSNDGGGTWTGTDYTEGTLTVTIDQQRADDSDVSGLGVVTPTPTYSHISEL
jgi:hypothetical protein